jgi:hypothetical protein
MKNIITNAADITVLAPIDNTYKTGGGLVSVGATAVRASKGRPGEILKVYDSTWEDVLGKPLSKKVGTHMEGLRHLADAAKDCNYVNVVRVVGVDYKFPSMALDDTVDTISVLKVGNAAGEAMACAVTELLKLWVIDGDASVNRTVAITDAIDGDMSGETAINGTFTITFTDKDENGESYTLESYVVSTKENGLDDMGLPAFIETVLENNSDRFRCDIDTSVSWVDLKAAIADVAGFATAQAFTGGTEGATEPTAEEWDDAWDLFRNESVNCDLMFAAGNLDEDVLENCIEIAELRHCSFFFDASPAIKHDAAITWLTTAGLESRQAACYHAPFAAKDKYYGGKTVWGVSGEVAAACARGDAIMTGSVPGIHYAPAGGKRAKLTRTGVTPLYPDDILDRDALYTARINPVIASQSGGAVVDDCLSLHYKTNYSRFVWVNRILNYIDHRFVEAAGLAKFEPDGLTYDILYRLCKTIMDDLVTSGALVEPRDPDTDGTEPYILTIEQQEIDLWLVTWEVCPTGAARRIAGQPKLIK